jgi:hypothetical protein
MFERCGALEDEERKNMYIKVNAMRLMMDRNEDF